jgi:ribosome biogenesis GTPase / thiamine phosphate phosphatase
MVGKVIKSTGSNYTVLIQNNVLVNAKVKGNFRTKDIKSTNPIAAGDDVVLKINDDNDAFIIEILPRKNYIIRKSINLSKQTHIIASNIDRAMLIVTLAMPRTSAGFIDRFLVTAEAYQIPTTIVFNKFDLYAEESVESVTNFIEMYENIGYQCIKTSAISGLGLNTLREMLTSGNTLLSGHSGVGKSTLINVLDNNLNLKTGEISDAHSKGKHTTTFAEMHKTKYGGFVTDTPGIKELGLVEINKTELHQYFPEFRALATKCKYKNCMHINEPNCEIIRNVNEYENVLPRYNSYLGIYEQL